MAVWNTACGRAQQRRGDTHHSATTYSSKAVCRLFFCGWGETEPQVVRQVGQMAYMYKVYPKRYIFIHLPFRIVLPHAQSIRHVLHHSVSTQRQRQRDRPVRAGLCAAPRTYIPIVDVLINFVSPFGGKKHVPVSIRIPKIKSLPYHVILNSINIVIITINKNKGPLFARCSSRSYFFLRDNGRDNASEGWTSHIP